ncbi:MAG: hydroxyethylthiazole kinase [Legionellaceae bacterium]|nr:hydroxyethylthiazole kinase [Legionellaceae bacterium]
MYTQVEKRVIGIKEKNPLILNITNHVTMDFIANGLLSLGASPIMIQATEEVEDLLKIADGIVINIGTLNAEFVGLCEIVCRVANRLGKPLTLDPVGAGASAYRTKICLNFLEHFKFDIIRGNASEIMALSGIAQQTKGVDSRFLTQDAVGSGQYLATQYDAVVAISGKTDAVIDTNRKQLFEYGSPFMPRITGSGCLLSSVVSAFHAVDHHCFEAVAAAVVFYGVCGEIAAKKSSGPGTFKPHFLDALACMPERGHYE